MSENTSSSSAKKKTYRLVNIPRDRSVGRGEVVPSCRAVRNGHTVLTEIHVRIFFTRTNRRTDFVHTIIRARRVVIVLDAIR